MAASRSDVVVVASVGAAIAIVVLALFWMSDAPFTLRVDNRAIMYPMSLEAWRSWRSGALPQWTDTVWGGVPLLSDPQTAAFYPPTMLAFALTPAPQLRAYDLATAAHFGWLAAGVVVWLRRLGVGRAAAVCGAVLTVLGPFTQWWAFAFLASFSALAWWPWVLVAVDRLIEPHPGRSYLTAPIPLAAIVYAGYPEFALYAGALALAWLWCQAPGLSIRSRALRSLAYGAGGLALAAPQLIPTILHTLDSVRAAPLSGAGLVSIELTAPWMAFDPRAAGTLHLPTFVGVAAPCLAILAVAARARGAVWLASAAVVAFVLALGSRTPWYDWLQAIPPFSLVRTPAKLWLVGEMALAWLAAVALDRVWRVPRRSMVVVLVGLGVAALAERGAASMFALARVRASPVPPPAAALVDELQMLSHATMPASGPPRRALLGAGVRQSLLGAVSAAASIETVHGGLLPLVSQRLVTIARHPQARRAIDAASTALTIVPATACDGIRDRPRARQIAWQGPSLCAMLSPAPPARYTLLARWESVPDEAAMLARLDRVPPGPTPILEAPAGVEPVLPATDAVAVTTYRRGYRRLTVRAPHPALLLARDAWAPGWTAHVDGRAVPIHLAEGVFFAVPVPAGDSTVDLRFTTPGLSAGVAVSAAWLAGALMFARRRSC